MPYKGLINSPHPPTERALRGWVKPRSCLGMGCENKTIYPAGETNPCLRSLAHSLVIILTDLDSVRCQK
jgi:hypothetical protein